MGKLRPEFVQQKQQFPSSAWSGPPSTNKAKMIVNLVRFIVTTRLPRRLSPCFYFVETAVSGKGMMIGLWLWFIADF
jgi:hypothetical protein